MQKSNKEDHLTTQKISFYGGGRSNQRWKGRTGWKSFLISFNYNRKKWQAAVGVRGLLGAMRRYKYLHDTCGI